MKCPNCGKEITTGTHCSECGKEQNRTKGMEVSYKDFRITEMLDIRMTSDSPSANAPEKTSELHQQKHKQIPATPEKIKPSGDRSLTFIAVAIIIFVAALVTFFVFRMFS